MDLVSAKRLAEALMKEHKLEGWKFKFDNAKLRFGKCSYTKKEISLSKYLTDLNDEWKVKDTILHEVAHALLPRGKGHGREWRLLALSIGCDGQRCYDDVVKLPESKYLYECPECKKQIKRFKRINRSVACRHCCNKFNGGRFHKAYKLVEVRR